MDRRALFVTLIVAALGASLLFVYLRRFEQQASGGERVKVLMAIKPIERGAPINEDMLAVREVPVAYLEDRAVKASERAKVVGLRVANMLQPQQTLFWTDLAIATDERRDLSALVQPGNRAVPIRASNSDDKSFALIRPGDYVDVIATMATGGSQDARSAVVLLQKALVLAVGLETAPDGIAGTKDPSRATARDMVLTLSLNLQEAQLAALAAEKGHLSVALRNPEDQRVLEGIPDMNSAVLTDTKTRNEVQTGRRMPTKLTAQGGSK